MSESFAHQAEPVQNDQLAHETYACKDSAVELQYENFFRGEQSCCVDAATEIQPFLQHALTHVHCWVYGFAVLMMSPSLKAASLLYPRKDQKETLSPGDCRRQTCHKLL